MNIVEAWDNYTSSDRLMFQNCCRKLLKRTFLVRDKREDRKLYFFVVSNIDIFLNYFSFMGFEVRYDKDVGVIMLDNSPIAGDREKLLSNRYRFSKEETIVLCCLWMLYISRIREGTLSSTIVIGMSDLTYELEKYGARDIISKTSLENNFFKVFRNYSLIDIDGNVGDIDCKIILYPSLQFVLVTEEFEKFVKDVVEVVLADKDNIEEDLDGQNNNDE